MKGLIKKILQNLFFWQRNRKVVYAFISAREIQYYPDYKERCEFYLGNAHKIIVYDNVFQFYRFLFSYGPYRVIFSSSKVNSFILRLYFFNVDHLVNPHDGWVWHEVLNKIKPVTNEEIAASQNRFLLYYQSIPKYNESLILGTGPSLIKCRKLIDVSCYKIACNTIVKDIDLWVELKPHFLVAGDSIYHFGHNKYATSFRRDLKKCLAAYGIPFLYPAAFHPFMREEFREFSSLLIPIPIGVSEKINNNLLNDFRLPALGNVLNLLLLPLSTSLTRKVYLLGFDGRAKDDKLFWSNSNAHSYGEFIADIQEKHPRFFDYFIDNKNPFKYVNAVHGDALDENLTALENDGYEFITLSPSHTPTIQKRYKNIFNLD